VAVDGNGGAYNYGQPYSGPYTGAMAYLLPYIEQQPLYNQVTQAGSGSPLGVYPPGNGYYDFNTTAGAWAYQWPPYDYTLGITPTNGTGTAAFIPQAGQSFSGFASPHIKTFECPSDNPYTTLNVGQIDGWWVQSASLWIDYLPTPSNSQTGWPAGLTNYIACAGLLGDDPESVYGYPGPPSNTNVYSTLQYRGIFTRNSKTKFADITDGTSNTIAFGETLCGNNTGNRDFALCWFGSGSLPTYWGLSANPAWYQYSSKHTGIVQFAFADGSVRSIGTGVTVDIFYSLGGMADGRTVGADTY
jgi:hypothetical protein